LNAGPTATPDHGRERILAAAAELFRGHGYAAVSLRAIAARAGMRGGSVYHHFSGNEEIVAVVLDIGIQRVHQRVDAALSALPPGVGIDVMIHATVTAHLEALLSHSDFTSANVRIFGQVPPGVREGHKPVRRAYERLWAEMFERAVDAGTLQPGLDPRLARRALIGALNATLEWFDPVRDDPAAIAESYARLFLHGLIIEASQ